MQGEHWLMWLIATVIVGGLMMLSRSPKNDKARKKILEWLAKKPASKNELRSSLRIEGIRLSKWRFDLIMENLAWNQLITRNEDGKWIIRFERPPLIAMMKRKARNIKCIAGMPHAK